MNTNCQALEQVVRKLSDGMNWNWCNNFHNQRHAADCALNLMAKEGLIEQVEHPLGGLVWRTNGKLFGRTDGITNARFDALKLATRTAD